MLDEELSPQARLTKQRLIDELDIGESHSLAKRVDITFGLSDTERKRHLERLRGTLESMTQRTLKKTRGRKYRVEAFVGIAAQEAALFFVAVATRTV